MIRERYLIIKHDLDRVNNLIESIMERSGDVNVENYAEKIYNAANHIQNYLIVGESWN